MTTLNVGFVTETCCHEGCNLTFAFTREFYDRVRNDHSWWYCPAGHTQHYTGKSDEEKLREAEARELALKDQLSASTREGEQTRQALIRDRVRFSNGVCPCCNRSFENVRRHMTSQHPDYDVTKVQKVDSRPFKCSCGRRFESLRGLRVHQGHNRRDGWDAPKTPSWRAHLTLV